MNGRNADLRDFIQARFMNQAADMAWDFVIH
jgi:hypothetical protein